MITKEELVVGRTYTDLSLVSRTVLFIGEQKVVFKTTTGTEQLADIDVMLIVLSLVETERGPIHNTNS